MYVSVYCRNALVFTYADGGYNCDECCIGSRYLYYGSRAYCHCCLCTYLHTVTSCMHCNARPSISSASCVAYNKQVGSMSADFWLLVLGALQARLALQIVRLISLDPSRSSGRSPAWAKRGQGVRAGSHRHVSNYGPSPASVGIAVLCCRIQSILPGQYFLCQHIRPRRSGSMDPLVFVSAVMPSRRDFPVAQRLL